MNTKYLVVVAAMAVMLVAATTLATTDNAFADRKRHDDRKDGGYGKSQSLAQASDCGNGFISVADFCQEIGSQNQGKENSVAQSGNQEINVGVDLEDDGNGNGPPPPGACEECFDPLTDTQMQALAVEIADQFDIVFPANPTRAQIEATICDALELGPPDGLTPGNVNAAMAQIMSIANDVRQDVFACLNDLF